MSVLLAVGYQGGIRHMRATGLERGILDGMADRHRELTPRLRDIEIVSR